MKLKILLSISIWGIFLTIVPLNGQYSHPISLNGHIDLNFSTKDHETLGRINTYRFRINPSTLVYFHPYVSDISRYRYAIGVRTSLIMNYYQDDSWKQHWNYIGLYPIARYYLPFGTFIEANTGPRIFILNRRSTTPSSLSPLMHGRYLIWDMGFGIGHSIKISKKVSFEPIITYNISTVFKNYSAPAGYVPTDEAKSGFIILIGFQFMIYQPLEP